MRIINREQLIDAYLEACEVELQAFKPGNVSIYSAGHDMSVDDFRRSAAVSASPLTDPNFNLGEKIYYAVKATREAVGCNTNLGIILLCAPLIQAAYQLSAGQGLQNALRQVLANTTVTDADWAFRAILLAAPGGLGEAPQQDVHQAADVTLTQAMILAAERDRIAYQYASGYKDIFQFALFRYNAILARFGCKEWAALAVYAELLSQYPDSHVVRKYGNKFIGLISAAMQEVHDRLSQSVDPTQLHEMLCRIDAEFKAKGINPGTSADLTVATVLTASLEQYAVSALTTERAEH